MKKSRLFSVALLGINLALATGCDKMKAGEEMAPEMKTFYEQLTPDAKEKFMQLDNEHRKRAMDATEQNCKNEGECGGLGDDAVEKEYQDQMKNM